MNNDLLILPGATVLPPMNQTRESPSGDEDRSLARKQAPRSQKQRFATLNAFADVGARYVSPTAQACWWILFRETKPTGLARIGHRRIAQCIGRSRFTVMRALAELVDVGLLIVVQKGRWQGAASTYRLRPVPPDR